MKKVLFVLSILSAVTFCFAAKTYYKTDGNNGNDGLSAVNAKIDPPTDLAAGDTLVIISWTITGTYRPNCASSATSLDAGPLFIGADADGNIYTDSTTRAVITASGTIDTMIYLNATDDYIRFKNLKIDGADAANYCIGTVNADGVANPTLTYCRITNAKKSNLIVRTASASVLTINSCVIDSAGRGGVSGWGIETPSVTRTSLNMFNSTVYGNLTGGCQFGQTDGMSTIEENNFIKNGTALSSVSNTTSSFSIKHNVFDSNTTAITVTSGVTLPIIRNNSFSHGTTAINTSTGNIGRYILCDYNNFYDITTKIDINGGTPPGTHNKTGNPNYKDSHNKDYTPQSPSSLIGAGAPTIRN